jgi:hypothetical protein
MKVSTHLAPRERDDGGAQRAVLCLVSSRLEKSHDCLGRRRRRVGVLVYGLCVCVVVERGVVVCVCVCV